MVIFNRVDRLGRDLEVLSRLGKLFESTGVRAYVCRKNGFINWRDPSDWEYWARGAVSSEKESRELAARLLQAWEFNRHVGLASYRVPFGYRRNENRKYERDPEKVEAALRLKEIFFEESGNIARLKKRAEVELGLNLNAQTYRDLITNPVWRGHTGVGWNKARRVYDRILYNTHADEAIVSTSEWERIQQLLAQQSKYRGANVSREPKTLTALPQSLPNPEIERLEGQIRQLRKFQLEMGDSQKLMERQIQVLFQRIANIQSSTPNQAEMGALRAELGLLSAPEPWSVMTGAEKRAVSLRFVDRVVIDLKTKSITVKPTAFLGRVD